MARADGSGPIDRMTDGQALEMTPAFTPDGRQIVFASNRPTGRLKICQMPASGKAGLTLLFQGTTTDLWPSVDNDPNPRVYFEGLLDSPRQPRLFMVNQFDAGKAKELNPRPGTQPRVSPRADSVVFTAINPDNGKQEIWRMSDRGEGLRPLVNTPPCNNRDPVWSPDGSKIAFASDRTTVATDDGKDVPNFDIYVIDLAHPERPRQITTNGSWDDCPAWDATGNYLYFRSNRGGEWGIWKISVR
jgi:Tol biopolymer transport system component